VGYGNIETSGLGLFYVPFSSRGYPALVLERRYEGTWALSQCYVYGRRCFRDRGEGGPSRPSMINFSTGGLDRFQL
jgi:hypothetical protein